MILYNTLMGVCAGGILLLIARLVQRLAHGYTRTYGSTGLALMLFGVPLTFLSGLMAVTWPLTVNPPINIAFAEPALLLGLLAIAAGSVIVRVNRLEGDGEVLIPSRLDPIRWVVFVVGLVLASVASAILSYDLVGDAPPQEPITGQFTGWENTFFGVIYALAALGCLLTPWVSLTRYRLVTRVTVWSWYLAGAAFLLFSVLNYRTHIGLLINLERGTNYRW